MTPDSFKRTTGEAAPPSELSPALQALWWAAKGDWNRAHVLVQDDPSREAAYGPAYQTSIAVLILSVPTHYLPIYQK